MANWKAGTTNEQKLFATMKRWKKEGKAEWQVHSWFKAIEREFHFGRTKQEQEERAQNWMETYRRLKV